MPRSQLPALSVEISDVRATQIFAAQAARIRRGYRERRAEERGNYRSKVPPWNTPNGFLKREVYRLVRHFDLADSAQTIIDLVRRRDMEPADLTYQQNKFHWGFLAIAPGTGRFISRQDRSRFSSELMLADAEDVPELYLIGFLYQIGQAQAGLGVNSHLAPLEIIAEIGAG